MPLKSFAALESVKGCVFTKLINNTRLPPNCWSQSCLSKPVPLKSALFVQLPHIVWGVAPVYFKQLMVLPAAEILMHRVIWSAVFGWVYSRAKAVAQ